MAYDDRGQALRHIMGQIDGKRRKRKMANIGREALNPEFAYEGDPNRDPFQAPFAVTIPAPTGPMGPALDAGGQQIPPQILAAMQAMRARAAMPGIQTDGEQVEADFRRRGGYQRSPLWG